MPPLPSQRPPTLDAIAAARWQNLATAPSKVSSPWLHEEVARRMEDRLQWIVKKPERWMHWEPLRGGLEVHSQLVNRYPQAQCFVAQTPAPSVPFVRRALSPAWWDQRRWRRQGLRFDAPEQPVQMLWANMALHMAADPQSLIERWHSTLEADGFLMFSCFGPDTLGELRSLHAQMGWPAPAHEFTDMHDWGDMLVEAGFAEPVMDMERITLTFSTADALLAELRGLGRNLYRQRFAGLRGRRWYSDWKAHATQRLADPSSPGRLRVQFEIIYGHAFKPQPRIAVRPQTSVSLQDFRTALRNSVSTGSKDPSA